jgi:hypothetical protein
MPNSKFGTPDPDWDYNHAWKNLIKAHNNLAFPKTLGKPEII